ncbi:MAG: PqqD family peptide modification chaperone [Vicinamibacteria bacterium]|nr:PqqD family peptide modification chaperone [Vicinamibacteria bacterium]
MEQSPGAGAPPALDTVYRRSATVATRVIADETLIVPFRGTLASLRQIFALNPVAAFVWGRIDGSATLAVILDAVLERFEVTREQAAADLLALIAELAEIGLVEPAPGTPPTP